MTAEPQESKHVELPPTIRPTLDRHAPTWIVHQRAEGTRSCVAVDLKQVFKGLKLGGEASNIQIFWLDAQRCWYDVEDWWRTRKKEGKRNEKLPCNEQQVRHDGG